MFKIKICGITRLSDALAAADAGADAIGFNFYRAGRRFVEPDVARQIADTLPKHVMKVGVFVNHSAVEIADTFARVGLDGIQLHGDERPALMSRLPNEACLIRAHRCGNEGLAAFAHYLDECRACGRMPNAVLVDADVRGEYGGTGHVADWARIVKDKIVLGRLPLILAGGLTPDNVAAAIRVVRPDAVDVASGVEIQPGVKDESLIKRFVAAAQGAFSAG